MSGGFLGGRVELSVNPSERLKGFCQADLTEFPRDLLSSAMRLPHNGDRRKERACSERSL